MDGMAVETPGGSRDRDEAVGAGDALRARMQFAVAQNHTLVGQTQFADAKAAALMTLAGLALLRGPIGLSASDPLALAALACTLASMLLALWAILPRYPSLRDNRAGIDRFTWTGLDLPDWDEAAQVRFTQSGSFADLLGAVASSNVGGARILRKKFRALRVAFAAAMLALLLTALRAAI